MEFEQIKELIKLINDSELAFFELSDGSCKIKMDKSLNRNVKEESFNKSSSDSEKLSVNEEKISNHTEKKEEHKKVSQDTVQENDDDLSVITSPMVGTFYSKSSPDSEAFVKEGDSISKGKIVCIIEAMKLMNEIESDYSGTIVKCLVKDGDMVEYGQPLFKIREE